MALLEALIMNLQGFTSLLSALLFLLLAFVLLSVFFSDYSKDPPGPKPLPFLGNLLHLDLKRPHESLYELSRKYGSVFTAYLGPKKVIVLSGYRTVKEALANHGMEFGERDITPLFYDYNKGHGILFANGESWRVMRRFALATLKNFGMGKSGSERKIMEEIHFLKEVFEKYKGQAFDTSKPINCAVSNVICSIVYGNRFDYEDSKFKAMVDRANACVKMGGSPSIQLYNLFPWLGPWLKTWRKLMNYIKRNHSQMVELVKDLKESLNPEELRCFVDCFLACKQKAEESGQNDSLFHEQNLYSTVSNLFVAGTDTTSTTLRWSVLLMAKYPQIQDRVQEEIDGVIGCRQPVMEDRKNLPYTDAVIHEIQRYANILPMNLPHTASCDIQFQGFSIKKGTCVFPLLTSVLRDEKEWESPHMFNPEHFLDGQGQFLKRDAFMPFSAGRRVCLGESLARMELFLFFTTLLQHFRFTPPPGLSEDQLDLTPVFGVTLSPAEHKLCAVKRL